jgi:hypothetical protein
MKATQGDTFAGQRIQVGRIYLAAKYSKIRVTQIIRNN